MTRSKRQKALLKLAEAFGTPFIERTIRQNTLANFGICYGLFMQDIPHRDLADAVMYWMGGNIYLCQTRFIGGGNESHDLWRSTLASFLAAMTDKEYNDAFGVE